jgi:hypothetical protein
VLFPDDFGHDSLISVRGGVSLRLFSQYSFEGLRELNNT